jgi:polyhydroxyalkanoate synthesis regulator phasin
MSFKKGISGLVLVCLVLALGSVASAGPCGPGDPPTQPPNTQEREKQVADKLSALVDSGTISKQQSERVIDMWRQKDKERQAEFVKMKNMSPEERKAYMDANKKARPDMVGDLMRDAGLNEDQAKAVAEALRPPGPPPQQR